MPMISGRNKNKNVIVACMRTCHACSIDFDLITKNNGPSKTKKRNSIYQVCIFRAFFMTLSQSFSAKGRRRGSPPACVHPTICPSLHVTPPLSSNPNSARVTNCSVKHASCREESKEWALFQQSLSLFSKKKKQSLSLSLSLSWKLWTFRCVAALAPHIHLAFFSFIPLFSKHKKQR